MARVHSDHVRLLLLELLFCGFSAASVEVTYKPEENATLNCTAPSTIHDVSEVYLKWTKPGLKDSYLLMFRDGRLDPTLQDSSYRNRVELAEPDLKNQNLSLILKNVEKSDSGLYECHFIGDSPRKRRATNNQKHIQTINLKVRERTKETGGDEKTEEDFTERERPGLVAGFMVSFCVVVVVVVGVVGVVCKRKKTAINKNQNGDPEKTLLSGSDSGSDSGSGLVSVSL